MTLLDDAIVTRVASSAGSPRSRSPIRHFYSSMVEWAKAFDADVYLHADDREWVMRPDDRLVFWKGETRELGRGLTLVRCGGHFAGGTVLHWAAGSEGRGALLSGDIVTVVQDRRWVSFMYSYPNLIPLPAETVLSIVAALEPYLFERIYGAWWGKVVPKEGNATVARSAKRYATALAGTFRAAARSTGHDPG
jgi:glyoxylase-like metal-dependent hydrolase (beta-lactamase superfamily II)